MSTRQAQLAEFFGIFGSDVSIEEAVTRYVAYLGILNFGQRVLAFERLKTKLGDNIALAAASLNHLDIIGQYGEITRPFFELVLGGPYPYHDVRPLEETRRIKVLEASKNAFQSDQLPGNLSQRMSLPTRLPQSIIETKGHLLYCSDNGYQYFSKELNRSWVGAFSRLHSRCIGDIEILDAPKTVVVAQDCFDGTNIAHFTYDYLPRIMYFCELVGAIQAETLFVIGGEMTPLQHIVLQGVCERYGLTPGNFLFTSKPLTLRITGSVYFFEDQMSVAHPLNMCHPLSINLVRSLVIPTLQRESKEVARRKIYISRDDAVMRRIANEESLTSRLAKLGFEKVVLSDLQPIEQLRLVSSARAIVAPHGMGLTGILFNQLPATLLELFHPRVGSDAYAFTASAIGIDYRFIVGVESRQAADLSYDIDIERVTAAFVDPVRAVIP